MSKHEVQTRGVVISRFSAGEGSVRVSVLTEKLGLISAVAKSAREERSKLRPHLTVGTLGAFNFVRGREVWRVTGAVRTKNCYFAHAHRPLVQKVAMRYLSLLRTLIQGEERDEQLFLGVWGFFTALEVVTDDTLVHLERFAALQLLAASGYVSKEAIPGIISFEYTSESIRALVPLEKQIERTLKEGFVASGLI